MNYEENWFELDKEKKEEEIPNILDKYKGGKNDENKIHIYIDAYFKHEIILEYARHNSLTLLNSPDSYDNFLTLSLQIKK